MEMWLPGILAWIALFVMIGKRLVGVTNPVWLFLLNLIAICLMGVSAYLYHQLGDTFLMSTSVFLMGTTFGAYMIPLLARGSE